MGNIFTISFCIVHKDSVHNTVRLALCLPDQFTRNLLDTGGQMNCQEKANCQF